MYPYYLMEFLPVLGCIFFKLCRFPEKKVTRYTIDIFFIIWLVILIFRAEEVGTDLQVYKYRFKEYATMEWGTLWDKMVSGEVEPGYVMLSRCIYLFSSDFRAVIIVCALISVVPIWMLYRKQEEYGLLLFMMFINVAPFSMYFSGLRQVLSMAFVVPAYNHCKNKKLWRFILSVLFAFLFHKSALMLLILYPVYHLKLRSKFYLLLLIPVTAIIYYFKTQIFTFLFVFFNEKYYTAYISSIGETGATSVLLLLLALMLFCYIVVDESEMNAEDYGLRNILVASSYLQIFAGVSTISMRMNYYFLILVPLAVAHSLKKCKVNANIAKLAEVCLFCFFAFYFVYNANTSDDILNVFPYVSMFDKGI